jgi:hypothetical protein
MTWQQIAMIVLLTLNIGIALSEHGKPREGKHNFWTTFFGVGLFLWLLLSGGYFK